MEWIFSGMFSPGRQVNDVVEKLVLLIPQVDAGAAMLVMAWAMYRKCSKYLIAMF